MSAAARNFALICLGVALAACGEAEQNTANDAAAADVEALPPDESAATPTDELANGAAEPQGNEPANAY